MARPDTDPRRPRYGARPTRDRSNEQSGKYLPQAFDQANRAKLKQLTPHSLREVREPSGWQILVSGCVHAVDARLNVFVPDVEISDLNHNYTPFLALRLVGGSVESIQADLVHPANPRFYELITCDGMVAFWVSEVGSVSGASPRELALLFGFHRMYSWLENVRCLSGVSKRSGLQKVCVDYRVIPRF